MTETGADDTRPDPFHGPNWGGERSGRGRVRVRVRRRKKRTKRRILLGLAVLVALVVLGGAWLAWNALHARSELQQVRADVARLQSEVSAGDLTAATTTANDMRGHAAAAHSYVDSPIWSLGQHVPFLGGNLTSARTLTTIVDQVAQGALPRLVDAAGVLAPSKLHQPDGSIDLTAIEHAAPPLAQAHATLASATADLQQMSRSGWASIESARTELLARVQSLNKTIGTAQEAAQLAPPLLGAAGPRSYMVTFQNDAEMRTTGGMPGAFAILQVTGGRLHFVKFEPDDYLIGTTATGVDFGHGYDAIYGTSGNGARAEYRNTNLSPNFPYAAQLWLGMWRHKTGQQLDGAITLDPTALSYLLAASGPAKLADGTTVTADNVVAYTQSTIYQRYATDNAARKQHLLDIAQAASTTIMAPGVDLAALVHGAAQAASEQRLLLWVRDRSVEAKLASLPIGGVEPQTTAPYFRLALWNATGSKLDYYIHAAVDWSSSGCGAKRHVTATVTITNDAPAGLPDYVTGGPAVRDLNIPPGEEYLAILAYTTQGGVLAGYSVNGHATEPAQLSELGHPVFSDGRYIPRGGTVTIVYRLTEPASTATPIVPAQPMVNPMKVTVHQEACG